MVKNPLNAGEADLTLGCGTKIPHTREQLSPLTAATERKLWSLRTATEKIPHAATTPDAAKNVFNVFEKCKC